MYVAILMHICNLKPVDVNSCHLLDAPENGIAIPIKQNGVVKYTSFNCNPNYVLKGNSLAICNDGVWSSSTPTCTKL